MTLRQLDSFQNLNTANYGSSNYFGPGRHYKTILVLELMRLKPGEASKYQQHDFILFSAKLFLVQFLDLKQHPTGSLAPDSAGRWRRLLNRGLC